MRRLWPFVALVTLTGIFAVAQAQPPIQPKDGKFVVPLTVTAASPPKPALKYPLLPELRELQPGNQIPAYYRCFFEQHNLFHNKESFDQQQKWLEAPLSDLAKDAALADYAAAVAKQAEYASRLDTVDWQLTNQARADGAGILLPDVHSMRMLIRVLKIRARAEIARGEMDTAAHTIQTMFALSRTFNEHPFVIGQLVGIALTAITLSVVEEFIQQPGAPNLFWSLAALPSPFIDLRKASQGEKMMLSKEFQGLRTATPILDADLRKLLKTLTLFVRLETDGKQAPSVYYTKKAENPEAVTAARTTLASFGHSPAELAKLSPLQVLLMEDNAQYEVDLDEFIKWTNIPFWQIPGNLGGQKPRSGPFSVLLPVWYKVILAKARTQQQLALIMVAEGVRGYAAENGNKPPASLDAVKLPLPVDPITGKPFLYEMKGDVAVIRATPPADQKDVAVYNRVYEITIRK